MQGLSRAEEERAQRQSARRCAATSSFAPPPCARAVHADDGGAAEGGPAAPAPLEARHAAEDEALVEAVRLRPLALRGGGGAREIAGSVRAAPAGGGAMWARAATRERRGGGGRARLDAGADAADEDAGPAGGGLGLDGHLGGHADGSEKGFRVSGVPRGQSRPPWEARTAGGAVAAGRGGVLRASHWTTGRTSSQKNCGGHGGSGRGGPGRERRPIAQRRAVRCAAGTETTARPSGGVWQYRERAS